MDGTNQFVGSDRTKMTTAIAAARVGTGGRYDDYDWRWDESADCVLGPALGGEIWMFGYDPAHTTHIGGGENGGITLTQVNIVRSMTDLGPWNGRQTG